MKAQNRSSMKIDARNDSLPLADVLTEPHNRRDLDEHGVRYRDRVFDPVTTTWGFFCQDLSDDNSCRASVARIIVHRAAGCSRGRDAAGGRFTPPAGRTVGWGSPTAGRRGQSRPARSTTGRGRRWGPASGRPRGPELEAGQAGWRPSPAGPGGRRADPRFRGPDGRPEGRSGRGAGISPAAGGLGGLSVPERPGPDYRRQGHPAA